MHLVETDGSGVEVRRLHETSTGTSPAPPLYVKLEGSLRAQCLHAFQLVSWCAIAGLSYLFSQIQKRVACAPSHETFQGRGGTAATVPGTRHKTLAQQQLIGEDPLKATHLEHNARPRENQTGNRRSPSHVRGLETAFVLNGRSLPAIPTIISALTGFTGTL